MRFDQLSERFDEGKRERDEQSLGRKDESLRNGNCEFNEATELYKSNWKLGRKMDEVGLRCLRKRRNTEFQIPPSAQLFKLYRTVYSLFIVHSVIITLIEALPVS